MNKTKFFQKCRDLLFRVKNNGPETGDFMFYSPEEKYKAAEYIKKGYLIASIFEVEGKEDEIRIDNDVSDSPYKFGFLVIKKSNKQIF